LVTCNYLQVNRFLLLFFLITATVIHALSQGFTRQTFHDKEKKHLKELYAVRDTIRNILHGRYISYYLNGNVESKGQFTNNETTGVWEFFFETGNLKMRGILRQNANFGLWEYFYESGQKSMEGYINGKFREGEWKSYYENGQVKEAGEYRNNKRSGWWKMFFEDGVPKGDIDYVDDHGTYTEYYHSGKVAAEGPRVGQKNVGHWRFFAEDGTINAEGEYFNGKRHGQWSFYHSSGKTAAKGKYENDVPVGKWDYFFDNGVMSSTGEYSAGEKSGYWKAMNRDGTLNNEVSYQKGSGDYREYYPSGKLRCKGKLVNAKKEGTWEYYFEDGKREGECEFVNNKGTYFGYYPNGNLQTKGTLDGDTKIGTWEIYENDGKLSGYYRPFYDDKKIANEILGLAERESAERKTYSKRKNMSYFDARFNEFRGVILATNPIMTLKGTLPVSVEFYFQERLGTEFEFIGIRDPFFQTDANIPAGEQFKRGYAIAVKQKFYNNIKTDIWYFGHELRFTNNAHFVNEIITAGNASVYTFSATEQRIEYGPLLGYRVMRRNNAEGFTVDAFVSFNFGFRAFDVDANSQEYFESLKQSRLSTHFNFGFNLGRVFSFR
jgi:uncharacterized protein